MYMLIENKPKSKLQIMKLYSRCGSSLQRLKDQIDVEDQSTLQLLFHDTIYYMNTSTVNIVNKERLMRSIMYSMQLSADIRVSINRPLVFLPL